MSRMPSRIGALSRLASGQRKVKEPTMPLVSITSKTQLRATSSETQQPLPDEISINVKTEEVGKGVNGILGFHLKPLDNLEIAAQWQLNTNMKLERTFELEGDLDEEVISIPRRQLMLILIESMQRSRDAFFLKMRIEKISQESSRWA